jgi:murein DD-endopeptidase MepM/ murein hydrolase activator NlpD
LSALRAWTQHTRTFAVGAGCGFLLGALLVSLLWQLDSARSPHAADHRDPAQAYDAIDRWPSHPTDAGGVERARDRPASAMGRPAPPPQSPLIGPDPASSGELEERDLQIPVEGVTAEQLTRQFSDQRGEARQHEAIDIVAPRNTPVRAVEGGTIARLFFSRAGGTTIYQFDPGGEYCYYYAHLEGYAEGLREGSSVRKGQILGYVGTSGNAPKNTPHLHFAIFRLTEARHWWEGTPIDPYDVFR